MQGNGKFDGTKIGRQVSAGIGYCIDEKAARFTGQLGQLGAGQYAQLGG
jgi:hypothetical protein